MDVGSKDSSSCHTDPPSVTTASRAEASGHCDPPLDPTPKSSRMRCQTYWVIAAEAVAAESHGDRLVHAERDASERIEANRGFV